MMGTDNVQKGTSTSPTTLGLQEPAPKGRLRSSVKAYTTHAYICVQGQTGCGCFCIRRVGNIAQCMDMTCNKST